MTIYIYIYVLIVFITALALKFMFFQARLHGFDEFRRGGREAKFLFLFRVGDSPSLNESWKWL